SIPVLEGLSRGTSAGGEWRRALGLTHSNLGIALHRPHRNRESEEATREAIRIQEQLVADFPSVPAYRGDRALSYLNLGEILGDSGRTAEAEEVHRAAAPLFASLTREKPDVPAYGRDE